MTRRSASLDALRAGSVVGTGDKYDPVTSSHDHAGLPHKLPARSSTRIAAAVRGISESLEQITGSPHSASPPSPLRIDTARAVHVLPSVPATTPMSPHTLASPNTLAPAPSSVRLAPSMSTMARSTTALKRVSISTAVPDAATISQALSEQSSVLSSGASSPGPAPLLDAQPPPSRFSTASRARRASISPSVARATAVLGRNEPGRLSWACRITLWCAVVAVVIAVSAAVSWRAISIGTASGKGTRALW
ncbi:hypothetical protein AMAG_18699 [Allomyces macrogynus ATCC 38327]|uniref:Uncharacterized protein n=1 Tax=Allomyces macrogynus (strain ATCC 38327) TaxID=578462 RepID=A0A0L0SE88_ALLM3|nr:hypothetical protein AMAG_18699 [Allomyces macrogynus ATCC 38327]|eukprot:KNE60853.1 hypothetical protein AMAG_18699 [Allomyces macrogynus ATCC 38327]